MALVEPHGGRLHQCLTDTASLERLAAGLERVVVDEREVADLELVACGAASPLSGFLEERDYHSVLRHLRLADGLLWPLPVTLAVARAPTSERVALVDSAGRLWAVMRVTSVYPNAPALEARAVYGTESLDHPVVRWLQGRGPLLVGGPLEAAALPEVHERTVGAYRLTPAQLRAELSERGWRTVAGFQTRNPLHRAHEYLTKVALETCDGLVIHPLVGPTKADDVPVARRFEAYRAALDAGYPKERVLLAAFPAAMRYAGPREALWHVLVRKNYGISSLIVGRDHAGFGSLYPADAAQALVAGFSAAELGASPLLFASAFFCRRCESMATSRTCPHGAEAHVDVSGSAVRAWLDAGQAVPAHLMRPEVAQALGAGPRFNPSAGSPPVTSAPPPRGTIVWLTGLSGAGKSTIARALKERLASRPVDVLDADEVRPHLSRGLGFSKEDRDANVERIGFVARALARNGVVAVVAAISPYRDARGLVRRLAQNDRVDFIEVHVDAPLNTLVARDPKGLYRRALSGELAQFTGVSDPYEAPLEPELRVPTDRETPAQSVERVMGYLLGRGVT